MKELHLKPKDPKKTLLRLFGYFKYNILLFIGGIFFIIMGSLAEIGINGMLSPVIDTLVSGRDMGLFVKYIIFMGLLVLVLFHSILGTCPWQDWPKERFTEFERTCFPTWKSFLFHILTNTPMET